MNSEDNFRTALIVILAILLPIGIYHRVRAASTGETISHAAEGWVLFAAIRLGGVAMLVAIAIYLGSPEWRRWTSLPIGPIWRWAGAALDLATIPLFFWTLHTLGKNLTDTVVTRVHHTLVTTGPYRFVRHPFYVCALLLIIGTTLLTTNTFLGVAGLVVFTLLAIRCQREEAMLVERFGDEYRSYMARTGRFIPRFAQTK
jgi:protein-S-isoprenylcysteine O-methyltransferase Ste14